MTSLITRSWLAFAALGTGMIHFGLISGSPVVAQVIFLALGLTESGWGVLALARDTLFGASVARVVALVLAIGWSLLVVAATIFGLSGLGTMLPLVPMAIATALELAAAFLISRDIRAAWSADAGPQESLVPDPRIRSARIQHIPAADSPVKNVEAASTRRYLLGVLAGALVTGALVTPALAATTAGSRATPHGGHRTSTTDPPPTGHHPH